MGRTVIGMGCLYPPFYMSFSTPSSLIILCSFSPLSTDSSYILTLRSLISHFFLETLFCMCFWVITTALALASNAIQSSNRTIQAAADDLDHYHKLFLNSASKDSIAKHLKKLTVEPHVIGTPENFTTTDYVYSGLDTHLADYEVLLTYSLQDPSPYLFLRGIRFI